MRITIDVQKADAATYGVDEVGEARGHIFVQVEHDGRTDAMRAMSYDAALDYVAEHLGKAVAWKTPA